MVNGPNCVMQGSSPLTRGAPSWLRPTGLPMGLIPAYAGSTGGALCRFRSIGAHPRLRGEHIIFVLMVIIGMGSSPLTRGARFELSSTGPPPGLIPAYAGSTKLRTDESEPPPAHPRLRGEHKRGYLRRWPCSGSSPLTRGARSRLAFLEVVCGLIPAYAGSTHLTSTELRDLQAHPRLRGEHNAVAIPIFAASGSSPLTRGAPSSFSTCLVSSAAHPRLRGEHLPTR